MCVELLMVNYLNVHSYEYLLISNALAQIKQINYKSGAGKRIVTVKVNSFIIFFVHLFVDLMGLLTDSRLNNCSQIGLHHIYAYTVYKW